MENTQRQTEGDKVLSVRVPACLVGSLEDLARDNDRTLSGEVRQAIRAHLDREHPLAQAA